MDEAGAYKKLMDNHGLTQEELSVRLGKSRSFIANMIRLLALPQEIKELLTEGKLTAGHARALLSLADTEMQNKFAARIIEKRINVRDTEQMVRKYMEDQASKGKEKKVVDKDKKDWEQKLANRLGRPIKIKKETDGSGALVIRYNNPEDLHSLLDKLTLK